MRKFGMLWIVYMLTLTVPACSFGHNQETITDSHTRIHVKAIAPEHIKGSHIVKRYTQRDMEYERPDMGSNHLLFYEKVIVIDTKYGEKDIARGHVIYHAFPGRTGYSLSRIVAFSEERIRIKRGQVYINGKELNTFYGRFRHEGMSLKQYVEVNRQGMQGKANPQLIRAMKLAEANMREITVPMGYVVVLDDDWLNGFDSKQFGALPLSKIQGKVVGYVADKE